MKYSIYVKNRLKKEILENNRNLSEEEATKKAEEKFHSMLLDAFYESALAKLDSQDPLKILELEDEYRFLDLHPQTDSITNIRNPYNYLYHGVRFDNGHKIFEKILQDRSIQCANKTNFYSRIFSDNCNEGKFISLIDYSEKDYNEEFQTFIVQNVSFIISSKLNPVKCKYLPFEEWEKIRQKLPKTKHRYSYAKHEYQYPDSISLEYVVGILYPLRYYRYMKGYQKSKEDLAYIRELLVEYGFAHLPILDPTDNFEILFPEPISINSLSSHYLLLK